MEVVNVEENRRGDKYESYFLNIILLASLLLTVVFVFVTVFLVKVFAKVG